MKKLIALIPIVLLAGALAPTAAEAGKHRLMPSDAVRVMYRAQATLFKRYGGDSFKLDHCTAFDTDEPDGETPDGMMPAKDARAPFYCSATIAGSIAGDKLADVGYGLVPEEPIEGVVDFSFEVPLLISGKTCKRARVKNVVDGWTRHFNGCPRTRSTSLAK